MNTKSLCRTGIIAALYLTLTLAFAPISYGAVQFRVSECLTVLPFFLPEAIIGLTVGCLLSNIFGGSIIDVFLGTTATLIASVITYFAGKKIKNTPLKLIVGEGAPIIVNAFLVPFTFLAFGSLKQTYFISALQVGLGQTGVILSLGNLVYFSFTRLFKR